MYEAGLVAEAGRGRARLDLNSMARIAQLMPTSFPFGINGPTSKQLNATRSRTVTTFWLRPRSGATPIAITLRLSYVPVQKQT